MACGGYDAVFDTEIDKKYTCPVCLAVLRDAVQTHCGHRFCSMCIANVVGSRPSARCPVDNTLFIVATQLFEDNAIRREILSFATKCCYCVDGCQWNGELRDYEDHVVNCVYRPVECTYNCGDFITFYSLQDHLLVCPRRPVICPHCEEYVIHDDMTKHQLLLCLKIPVVCTLCGRSGISRESIAQHVDIKTGDCPNIFVICKFLAVGCHFEDRRAYMSNHYADNLEEHLSLMLSSSKKNDEKIAEYQTVVQEQRNLIKEQSKTIEQLKTENRTGLVYWNIPVTARIPETTRKILYTGIPGYKICLELDFNGPSGCNTCGNALLSIYLMPGVNDDQMMFPFRLNCRVTIFAAQQLGLPTAACLNYTSSFRCSGRVPASEADNDSDDTNAIHVQKLMKTSTLLSSQYKKNGHIYMQVEVKL
ncbi:hypothetical protein SNE40_020372 [Patella caerulea]|uniref:Uncharacterized protein n=1 Tax=Patella caerulea TaxID=87958 RepID=A0AAN8IZL9_PATCE